MVLERAMSSINGKVCSVTKSRIFCSRSDPYEQVRDMVEERFPPTKFEGQKCLCVFGRSSGLPISNTSNRWAGRVKSFWTTLKEGGVSEKMHHEKSEPWRKSRMNTGPCPIISSLHMVFANTTVVSKSSPEWATKGLDLDTSGPQLETCIPGFCMCFSWGAAVSEALEVSTKVWWCHQTFPPFLLTFKLTSAFRVGS